MAGSFLSKGGADAATWDWRVTLLGVYDDPVRVADELDAISARMGDLDERVGATVTATAYERGEVHPGLAEGMGRPDDTLAAPLAHVLDGVGDSHAMIATITNEAIAWSLLDLDTAYHLEDHEPMTLARVLDGVDPELGPSRQMMYEDLPWVFVAWESLEEMQVAMATRVYATDAEGRPRFVLVR